MGIDGKNKEVAESRKTLVTWSLLRKMNVNQKKMSGFTRKHTRFIYNSDDKIEKEEEVAKMKSLSPGIVRLKGMPTLTGKHLRILEVEE
uniref:Uncharacterized protein n=1 Tax=Nelumbo nucifera TaxID=4432 RepID=A0A822ZLV7_NELNU|nr:TPA_asm: hypothetical protein HUJ06_002695 [Nelumbo nucifera]